MPPSSRSPAVDTAFRVLDFLAQNESEAGVSEIARALGISKGTCFNVLGALQAQDAVRKDVRRALYRLGPKLVELGRAARRNFSLRESLRQQFQPLVDETNLTGLVGVLLADNRGIVVLDRLLPRLSQNEPVIAAVGHVFQLPALAMGKVALAYNEDDEAMTVAARSGLDRKGQSVLHEQLAEIRKQGYAISLGEYARNVNAVAAPLRDRYGEIMAVLSLMGSTSQLPPEQVEEVARRLRALAESYQRRHDGLAAM